MNPPPTPQTLTQSSPVVGEPPGLGLRLSLPVPWGGGLLTPGFAVPTVLPGTLAFSLIRVRGGQGRDANLLPSLIYSSKFLFQKCAAQAGERQTVENRCWSRRSAEFHMVGFVRRGAARSRGTGSINLH